MKKILYTKHAEEMLTVRGIDKKMVESCLVQLSGWIAKGRMTQ